MRRSRAQRAILSVALGAVAALGPMTGALAEIPMKAQLDGDNEVPGPGDPNGRGEASLDLLPGRGRICYELRWEAIRRPTAAHIHRGEKGVAGDVAVDLKIGTIEAGRLERSRCLRAPRAMVREINRNPEAFYVNIHNRRFPAGALRGQIQRGK